MGLYSKLKEAWEKSADDAYAGCIALGFTPESVASLRSPLGDGIQEKEALRCGLTKEDLKACKNLSSDSTLRCGMKL